MSECREQQECTTVKKEGEGRNMEMMHHNCRDSYCLFCMRDCQKLEEQLKVVTGTGNLYDLLGRYHKWLSSNGIPAETEWGWFSPESFDDTNIERFCTKFM